MSAVATPEATRVEWPRRSGIFLQQVTNYRAGVAFGTSFRVTIPARYGGRGTQRRQFANEEDARRHAEDAVTGWEKEGRDYFTQTDQERHEFAARLPLLRARGLSVGEALDHALKTLHAVGRDKTLADIVAELTLSKHKRFKSGDLRPRSYEDFVQRCVRVTDALTGPVCELTAEQIKNWIAGLKLSPRSNKNFLMTLGELLKHGMARRYLSFNPMSEMTRDDRAELIGSGSGKKEPGILTIDQATNLLNAARAHPELDMLGVVTLGLFAGIRSEELRRISWADVRLDALEPYATVSGEHAKKRARRNVPLSSNALVWLRLALRTGRVAASKDRNDFTRRFMKVVAHAGITKWPINGMRHSFGSHHAALGNHLATAAAMGHRQGDQVLFDFYRTLVTKEEAEAYFNILPK